MDIRIKRYSDGFYALSATVNDKTVRVTYSDRTKEEDAYKDFEKVIKEAKELCRIQ